VDQSEDRGRRDLQEDNQKDRNLLGVELANAAQRIEE
jgi:hypothetical protein